MPLGSRCRREDVIIVKCSPSRRDGRDDHLPGHEAGVEAGEARLVTDPSRGQQAETSSPMCCCRRTIANPASRWRRCACGRVACTASVPQIGDEFVASRSQEHLSTTCGTVQDGRHHVRCTPMPWSSAAKGIESCRDILVNPHAIPPPIRITIGRSLEWPFGQFKVDIATPTTDREGTEDRAVTNHTARRAEERMGGLDTDRKNDGARRSGATASSLDRSPASRSAPSPVLLSH